MDQTELISVIVPVFRVEKYLDRCVQSIVDQTYRNLEIMLVDDGSPDNCPAMCDIWAAKDSRIKVIHTENNGVSNARNVGVSQTVGEYICMIDSDDWVDSRFVEQLYCAIKANNAGIAACRMVLSQKYEVPQNIQVNCIDLKVYSAEEALASLISGGVFQGGPCDKMYHRSILEAVRFEVGRRHEDEFFTFRAIHQAGRLVTIDVPLYYYFQRTDSFMHTSAVMHLDILDAYLARIAFLQKKYPSLVLVDKTGFCVACVSLYREILNSNIEDRHIYTARIRESRKKVSFSLVELASLSIKHMIYVMSSRNCLPLIARLLNCRGRRGKNE